MDVRDFRRGSMKEYEVTYEIIYTKKVTVVLDASDIADASVLAVEQLKLGDVPNDWDLVKIGVVEAKKV